MTGSLTNGRAPYDVMSTLMYILSFTVFVIFLFYQNPESEKKRQRAEYNKIGEHLNSLVESNTLEKQQLIEKIASELSLLKNDFVSMMKNASI
uniref:Uncharacterized protein n=1 Tax=Romanomermis culicivorax TaxID=13658 RepID=A0A915HMY6_ROMCU